MLHLTLHHWLPISLAAALVPLGAYGVEKPNLTGSWHCNTSKSTIHQPKISDLTWVIDQKGRCAPYLGGRQEFGR